MVVLEYLDEAIRLKEAEAEAARLAEEREKMTKDAQFQDQVSI